MENTLQLSKTEIRMMEEVFKVFSKYKNKTRKFGLQLVHSHFSIYQDEILYETHDKQTRTLTTTPINKSIAMNALATSWEFKESGKIFVTSLCCDSPPDGPNSPNDPSDDRVNV